MRARMRSRLAAALLTGALAVGASACSAEQVDKTDKTVQDAATKLGEAADDAQAQAEDGLAAAQQEAERLGKQVDWQKYPEHVRQKVEKLAAEDNCHGLAKYADKLDPGKNGDLVAYLQSVIKAAGCA